MKLRFFLCERCGNIVELIRDGGGQLVCCGQRMIELIPGATDGAAEKHVPVYAVQGGRVEVTVGSAEHPMTEQHHIKWIVLQTKFGVQRQALKPGDAPKACFELREGDKVEAVYGFCNLHGLWKA